MQFSTVIISALFAMVASATPVANANPDLAAREGAVLEERQTWCGDCKDGKQICCSATGCYPPTNC
ncbi:hypothetical protein CC79DRAFT_1336469 [Sarocladium strictum]